MLEKVSYLYSLSQVFQCPVIQQKQYVERPWVLKRAQLKYWIRSTVTVRAIYKMATSISRDYINVMSQSIY